MLMSSTSNTARICAQPARKRFVTWPWSVVRSNWVLSASGAVVTWLRVTAVAKILTRSVSIETSQPDFQLCALEIWPLEHFCARLHSNRVLPGSSEHQMSAVPLMGRRGRFIRLGTAAVFLQIEEVCENRNCFICRDTTFVKLDVPISGIQLSDWLHRKAHDGAERSSARSWPR